MAQLKNTIIRGGLSVLGETRLNDDLLINGDITHSGSALINGHLEIVGDLTLENISSFHVEKDSSIISIDTSDLDDEYIDDPETSPDDYWENHDK